MATILYNRIEYLYDLDEHNIPYNLRPAKIYITQYDLLNNTDLTDSFPSNFLIKNGDIVIVDSETTIPNWISIVKSIWNSMTLKNVIYNTTFNLVQKEDIGSHDSIYKRGDIVLPFTMKGHNETFKQEIIRLVNINEYTIDITIKWNSGPRKGNSIHYKNF